MTQPDLRGNTGCLECFKNWSLPAKAIYNQDFRIKNIKN